MTDLHNFFHFQTLNPFNYDNSLHISSTSPLQASIQLTEEMLTGEEQTVEFQGSDKSGKFIVSGVSRMRFFWLIICAWSSLHFIEVLWRKCVQVQKRWNYKFLSMNPSSPTSTVAVWAKSVHLTDRLEAHKLGWFGKHLYNTKKHLGKYICTLYLYLWGIASYSLQIDGHFGLIT